MERGTGQDKRVKKEHMTDQGCGDFSNPTLGKELYSIDILHSRDGGVLLRVSQYWREGQA
jgi:hypothetical protein